MRVSNGARRYAAGVIASVVAFGGIASLRPAAAAPPTIVGYASNFDVTDSTDRPCHGFEVEIEDVTDSNVVYTWGNYHYGHPTTTPVAAFPSGHAGVRVKYQATYTAGTWSQTTPVGGIEHFGVSLNATAGVQRYSWLCEDPASPGTLVEYGGSTSGNYYPMPPPPAPTAVVVPTPSGEVVRQEITNGEPPEPGQQAPDAVWVRRYAASSNADVTLDQLTANDPAVQETVQQSMLNGQFELVDGGASLTDDDPVSASDEASVLVVDTYAYTGPYDDAHTPSCDGAGGANDCSNFVGSTRLSRQMFSADLATATTTRVALTVSVITGLSPSADGGSVTSGAVPSADPETGIDCGTSCFTVVDGGTALTLTANPNPGYHLQSWGGACSGSATTCTVTVSANTPVTATFMPDDPAVYVADAMVVEGKSGQTTNVKVAVALSAAQPAATTVNLATGDGTATAPDDYVAKAGSVKIAAGRTNAVFTVAVRGDGNVEGDESFGIDVTSVGNPAVAIGNPSAPVTIVDDDTTASPVASLGTTSLYEGNGGTQTARVTVTLSRPSTTVTPVQYHTADATATAGSDYVAKAGTVNIPAGATSATIGVTVKADTTAEGDETFRVVVDGTGSSGVATDHDDVAVTVLDDDTLSFAGIGIGDATVMEGHTGPKAVALPVTLSAPRATDTVVTYRTVDGSAVAGADFTAKSGSLRILAGKTSGVIMLTVPGDTALEGDEGFSVLLGNAGAVPVHHGTGAVTVIDDDA